MSDRSVGRPTKRTPEIVAKLEQAFSLGSTVLGACFHAGIGQSTYYQWADDDPEFADRMKALKEKMLLKALNTIAEDLGNPHTAKWYLEKKHEDFKPKQAIDHNINNMEVAGDLLYKKNADK